MTKGYYHVYSFGEDTPKLLTTPAEFVIAINILAYCTTIFDVKVMVFIFMNSHFHLVLYGTEEDCRLLGEDLMKRLLRKINRNRSKPYLFEKVAVSCDAIMEKEQLLRVMTYDIRNSIEAGFPMDPRYYPWSSASLYFAPRDNRGLAISGLGTREKMRKMGVYYEYPEGWTISESGAVNYRHFVEYEAVENAFGGIRGYIAFMFIKKDQLLQMNMRCTKMEAGGLSDKQMASVANDLSRQLFNRDFLELDLVNRINLAQKLRRSRGIGIKQLARVLELDYQMLSTILP